MATMSGQARGSGPISMASATEVATEARDRRTRLTAVLAVAVWLAIVALSALAAWMIAVTLDRPIPDQWGFRGYNMVIALAFGSVGALVATRKPGNRIAWFGLGISLITAVGGIVDQYPVLAEATDPPLPGAEVVRWVRAWLWVLAAVPFLAFFPLIFPNGRLPSPRWRAAVLLGVAAVLVQVGLIIVSTQPIGPVPPTTNPATYFEMLGPSMSLGYLLIWVAAGVSASSLVLRYRRAGGEERQQIKWVAYAVVVVAVGAVVGMAAPIFLREAFLIGAGFFLATVAFAAAALAIAILRYRLYEIDLIINRTLVYGALSAVLAGVYTASITLSQRVFMTVTGERSDAAIVLTTLIVAATFTPLKARLQGVVDRRIKASAPGRTGPATVTAATGAGSETLRMLGQLGRLHAAGIVTTSEFETKKAELLQRI